MHCDKFIIFFMQYFKKPILNLPEIIRPGQKEKQIALCDEAIGLLTLNSNDNSIFEILKVKCLE